MDLEIIVIYKMKNKKTGDYYTIKEIKKENFDIWENVLEKMNKSKIENNISIKDIINNKEYLYIIMELCEYNLEELLKKK